MNLKKIPATIITGFLGSGKTTLLSNVIRQANGKRIAVIVNEFGELDIDADLLRSCPLDCEDDGQTDVSGAAIPEDGIYELANGCICCTVEEEFLPVMEQLVKRRDQIDHILIETSGLALPKPLVQAFNWPQIKQHCTVDSVITVVDGPAVADGRIAHDPAQIEAQRLADDSLDHDPSLQELLEDQLGSADMIIISKVDQLGNEQLPQIQDRIRSYVKPQIKMLEVNNGEIDSDLILGLNFASEKTIESIHSHHDHYHAHDKEHAHAHDHFDNHSLIIGEVDSERLSAIVSGLLAQHSIYRVKGFLALPGKPMRQVIQVVGDRMDRYFDRPWRDDEKRLSRLVFIGKHLDREQLLSELQGAVVS